MDIAHETHPVPNIVLLIMLIEPPAMPSPSPIVAPYMTALIISKGHRRKYMNNVLRYKFKQLRIFIILRGATSKDFEYSP